MSNVRVSKFNGCQNKSFLQDNEWFKRFHDSSHYYNIISRYANLIWITYSAYLQLRISYLCNTSLYVR